MSPGGRLARELELPPERLLPLRNAAILALSLPDLHVQQTVNVVPRTLGKPLISTRT